MATSKTHKVETAKNPLALPLEIRPVFGSFYPPKILYDETSPTRLYTSETSMLWALRKHRAVFVEAQAIGKHAGQIVVDPVRCAVAAEKIALQMAGVRAAESA